VSTAVPAVPLRAGLFAAQVLIALNWSRVLLVG